MNDLGKTLAFCALVACIVFYLMVSAAVWIYKGSTFESNKKVLYPVKTEVLITNGIADTTYYYERP